MKIRLQKGGAGDWFARPSSIANGSSPALQATVARIVALSPSIDVARKELRRQGLKLDKKTVRRLAEQLGIQFLAWRQRESSKLRVFTVPTGTEPVGQSPWQKCATSKTGVAGLARTGDPHAPRRRTGRLSRSRANRRRSSPRARKQETEPS